MARILVLVILAVALAGCGDSGGSAVTSTAPTNETETTPTTTAATTTAATTTVGTTTAPSTRDLQVFFLRDGKVAATTRTVPTTLGVGGAALSALFGGLTEAEAAAGLTTAAPIGADFSLAIDNGVATVVGPAGLSDKASAQLVYTLTQFPTVKTVRINGANAGDRSDWERLTPPILILTPTPGQTVTSPLHVAGTANTFEATLQLELQDGSGNAIAQQTVTATSGSGTRGTFEADLTFDAEPGTGKLVAYENSAENGERIHIVEVPLILGS